MHRTYRRHCRPATFAPSKYLIFVLLNDNHAVALPQIGECARSAIPLLADPTTPSTTRE